MTSNKTRQGYVLWNTSNRRVTFFKEGQPVQRSFDKAPTTYAQQVELLQKRGMVIPNPADAEFYLRHINYYRLSAYWRTFEADPVTHRFRPGTKFDDALSIYIFDRELRLLVLDAIESVEVSVRSNWGYQMAHRHGPYAYENFALAREYDFWQKNLDTLAEETNRSREDFIRHYRETYGESLPPIWVISEVMSLGQLSRWYSNLKPKPIRRAIADVYGIDEWVLHSWLRHFTYLRNICAHHSRLWNREFTTTPSLPKRKPAALIEQCIRGSRKPYNTLVILLYLMDKIVPQHHWRGRLKKLLAQYQVNTAAMGFPGKWEQQPIWRNG